MATRLPSDSFAPLDWALVAGVALAWGASFLLIDVGVDHFDPGVVAVLRLAFGAATLAVVPAARRGVARSEWPLIAVLGLLWMAVPFVLFPVAEQSIDSSLAGMINGAAPLFTAVIAALVVRHLPAGRQLAGLLIGFAGVIAVTAPSVGGAEATTIGVLLVLLATLLYGISINIAAPLQRRNGGLPIIWRAQLVALVLVTPLGAAGLSESSFDAGSLAAVAVLGALGTALAFVWFSLLVGRVGSTRGSVAIYFVPAVAIALGAVARDERIAASAIAGTALVTLGAYLTSRREEPRTPAAGAGRVGRRGDARSRSTR